VSMIQLVLGAALGFIIGQGVLHGTKQLVGWILRDEVRGRLPHVRGTALLGGFIKYSGVIGAIGALIFLGVWTIGDYVAARAAHRAASATVLDHPAMTPTPETPVSSDEPPATASVSKSLASPDGGEHVDPYADPDFKVNRRPHRAKSSLSLKEILVQRSEARAATQLLAETKDRMHRSQYDCEAADRASRYLQAGLDVWAFASWQGKYFPTESYRGAQLEACKTIDSVTDSPKLNLPGSGS
jgi:hypothetical protein